MRAKLFVIVVAAGFFALACGGDGTPTSISTIETNTPTSTVPTLDVTPTEVPSPTTRPSETTAATSPVPTEVSTGVPPSPTDTPTTLLTPTTVTFFPSQDNTLYEDDSGSFSNGTGIHFFVGLTNSGLIRRGLVKFDLAESIPTGSEITKVTLTLNMSKTRSGAETIELHRLLADWGEGTSDAAGNEGAGAPSTSGDATWAHGLFPSTSWAIPGGDFSATTSVSITVDGNGSYVWGPADQMIEDVQAWVDDPSDNFGWILLGNEAEDQTTKRFDTKEVDDELASPLLTVTYLR